MAILVTLAAGLSAANAVFFATEVRPSSRAITMLIAVLTWLLIVVYPVLLALVGIVLLVVSYVRLFQKLGGDSREYRWRGATEEFAE